MVVLQAEPKKIYIGSTEIKKVYLGSTQIREMPPYLCFTANTDGSTVKFSRASGTPTAITLETSTDGGTRTAYTIGDTITLSNIGDKVYFRNTSETTTGFSTGSGAYYHFTLTGSVAASGDITSLINKNCTDTLVSNYCFYQLFYECTSLTSTPKLPATTLTNYCYQQMFYGCTDIETLPKLYTLTLKDNCYNNMFRGCSKIKLSTTQTGEYQTEYRIPMTGTGTTATNWNTNMFTGTGGTFAAAPTINTTYYTSNTLVG